MSNEIVEAGTSTVIQPRSNGLPDMAVWLGTAWFCKNQFQKHFHQFFKSVNDFKALSKEKQHEFHLYLLFAVELPVRRRASKEMVDKIEFYLDKNNGKTFRKWAVEDPASFQLHNKSIQSVKALRSWDTFACS